jgi:hypothetical protein
MIRSNENTTSSAVKGAPSWNVTLRRSTNRHVTGSTRVHDVASAGSGTNCLL